MDGQKRYLALTCDVEALPMEAPNNHVDRLIWGKFPGVRFGAGIGLMMDIADEFGFKITFFLDVVERHAYGAAIEEVAHAIQERGHDLQLHLHVEFLNNSFWNKLGYLAPTWAMNLFDDTAAQLAIDYAVKTFVSMAGVRPLAYRPGAFRYNQSILRALSAAGIKLAYQYYPATHHLKSYPHGPDLGPMPVFRWSNGIVEIPMGCVENEQPRTHRYTGFATIMKENKALAYMRRFYAMGPEFNTLVLLLHSWSFLSRNEERIFEWKDKSPMKEFHGFLAHLPSNVEVVTAPQLLEKVEQGQIVPALDMPLCVAGNEALHLYKTPVSQLAAAAIF